MKNKNIVFDKGEVIFKNLISPNLILDWIKNYNESLNSNIYQKKCILNFKEVEGVFPNVCVPLTAILSELKQEGWTFEWYYLNEYLKSTGIQQAFSVSENLKDIKGKVLNKVWEFKSEQDVYNITEAFQQELSQVIVCEKGVLEGFDWGINEIMDNVLRHSTKGSGYVMGQVHTQNQRFAFCVCDIGQGIFNSFSSSEHTPKNEVHALKLAVSPGVTRSKEIGQGNGLWGLHQIIFENTGQLILTSSGASYSLINQKIKTAPNLPKLANNSGCIIDFQLEYKKEIAISKALGGHEPINHTLESLEDDRGNIVYPLKGKSIGTREAGQKMRTEILNLYKQSSHAVTLDFNDIRMISSAFADELIGKLLIELGFYAFNNIIKLKNMNSSVQAIAQLAVAQRLAESLNPPLK